MAATEPAKEAWFLASKSPVQLPAHHALTLSDDGFEAFVKRDLASRNGDVPESAASAADVEMSEGSGTIINAPSSATTDVPPSTTADIREAMAATEIAEKPGSQPQAAKSSNPWMNALLSHGEPQEPPDMENKMLTENADVAHRSSENSLVDLFFELEETISAPRLIEVLNAAWAEDPDSTLKIIFNARSIHLGKASRTLFYRCAGWLAQNHPLTLVTNLRWLGRPVVPKKAEKKEDGAVDDERPVLVDAAEVDEKDPAHHDVRNGVAHGYWKDLLNILALAAEDKLNPTSDPKELLNLDQRTDKEVSKTSREDAKAKRQAVRGDRHNAVLGKLEHDPVYRALHFTVARLFAAQLGSDLQKLRADDPRARRQISLCAKWAPSPARFHDKHTFVVSTLGELLAPPGSADQAEDRETSVRRAREGYRRDVAALRRQLEVVERDLSGGTLGRIKYDRVPSVAMRNYARIFAEKDTERFDEYITSVAQGKSRISGAVLLPSTLVKAVRLQGRHPGVAARGRGGRGGRAGSGGGGRAAAVEARLAEIDAKVADGQWASLVQRIRDSGTLASSIAVCDVSGSMSYPVFADGTCPMDSAIGLSLLVAEVAAPPFGGAFISFSEEPRVQRVDLAATLRQKVASMESSDWGMSTDFVAVFRKLILPLAVKNKVKPEDMVKRVFVFSDMQFNEAERAEGDDRWSTSFERVKAEYEKCGYEMPELVFWNLGGGRAGVTGVGDPTAPKPVTADVEGTALVSGYSQGMLKVFLEGGGFGGDGEEEQDEKDGIEEEPVEIVKVGDGEGGDDDVAMEAQQSSKKRKTDPLEVVKKAISHKAYSMLKVVD